MLSKRNLAKTFSLSERPNMFGSFTHDKNNVNDRFIFKKIIIKPIQIPSKNILVMNIYCYDIFKTLFGNI